MESQSHLNLDGVSEALYVLPSRDTPPPSYHPVPVLKERIHRNNFLYLCNQSAPIYEAVRGFLDDKSYWMKEEYHFSLINELIRLHNIIDGTCWRLEDAVCPPVDVIRKLYTDHQSCISRSGRPVHPYLPPTELTHPPTFRNYASHTEPNSFVAANIFNAYTNSKSSETKIIC